MPLDPQAQAFLDPLNRAGPLDVSTLSAEQARSLFTELGEPTQGGPRMASSEREIPGPGGPLRLRLYTPPGEGPFPMLAYFHGGGFVLGLNTGHDWIARGLSHNAGCIVSLVDYRLAPEAPFPAAPEDAFATLMWMVEHAAEIGGDPKRIAVAGDSAGGNLAAVVSLMARDRGTPSIDHQLLIYPVTDHSFETRSYQENAEGYLLTRDLMRWFWDHYLADAAQGRDPLASPLRASDLSQLPPATVITAEYDPLRDEGEAYAKRLLSAGTPTRLTRYSGIIHGFLTMPALFTQAQQVLDQSTRALRESWT